MSYPTQTRVRAALRDKLAEADVDAKAKVTRQFIREWAEKTPQVRSREGLPSTLTTFVDAIFGVAVLA